MVSKNNHEQKFEAVADRKPHFAIRKLTIGAASVLLGTSLWMSTSASTVHADKADSNGDGGQPDTDYSSSTSASTGTVDKVVVEQQGQSATENTNNSTDNSAATSEQTQNQNTQASTNEASQASSENAQQNNAATSEEKNSDATANSDNIQSANTEEKASTQKDKTTQNNQKTTEQKADSDKSSQNNSAATKQAENSSEQSTIRSNNNTTENKANSVANNANVDNSNIANTQTDLTQSANVQLNNLPSSSAEQIGQADKTTVKSDKNDTNELKIGDITTGLPDDALKDNLTKGTQALVKQAVTNGEIVAGKNADPTKQLDALRASLVEENSNSADNYKTVTDFSGIQNAINSGAKGVNISGSVTANSNLTLNTNQKFVINGINGASLNFGTNTINLSTGNELTLANITINSDNAGGAVVSNDDDNVINFRNVTDTKNSLFNGKGQVHIQGTVNTTVNDDSQIGTLAQQGFADAKNTVSGAGNGRPIGTNDRDVANANKTLNDSNWAIITNYGRRKVPNILASDLYLDADSILNVNREATGDGIVLLDGAVTNFKSGNVTSLKDNSGKVNVATGATLNINLKDSNLSGSELKNNEKGSGTANTAAVAGWIDNLNAGIRVNNSGSLITDNATQFAKASDSNNSYVQQLVNEGRISKNSDGSLVTDSSGNIIDIYGRLVPLNAATVNIKSGHGRAVVFSEPNISTDAQSSYNYIHRSWWNGDGGNYLNAHTGNPQGSSTVADWGRNNPGIKNIVQFGDYAQVNIMGRDGFGLGNNATFNSGKFSTVVVNNYGHGNAFDAGTFSSLNIDPSSDVEFYSDGKQFKDGSQGYETNNYVALGESGKIHISNNGIFKVVMTDRGTSVYNDNINIDSRDPNGTPEVYVGPNAILDIRSDSVNAYDELISIPNPASKTANFILDNVKYVNLEKTAKTDGVPNIPDTGITGNGANGGVPNLIFMNPGNGEASFQGKGNYVVFKWNARNLDSSVQWDPTESSNQNVQRFTNNADQTWTNIASFNMPFQGFGSSDRKINVTIGKGGSTISNHGASIDDPKNGFYPVYSQRLVLMSHYVQPVNPNKPLPPKYTKDALSKTRTIHYVVDDGTTTDVTKMQEMKDSSDQIMNPTIQNASGSGYVDTTTDQLVQIVTYKEANGTVVPGKYVRYTDTTSDHQAGDIEVDSNGNYVTEPLAEGDNVEAAVDKDGNYLPGTVTWTDSNGNTITSFAQVNATTPITNSTGTYEIQLNESKSTTDGGRTYSSSVTNPVPSETLSLTTPTSEDIYIVYKKTAEPAKKQGEINVKFHDTTDDVDIPGYGNQSGEQDVGTRYTYNPQTDINILKGKGYVLDGTVPTIPTEIAQGTQSIVIKMKHGTIPVTPDKPKNPTDPINPNDPDSPKYPDGVGQNDLNKTVQRKINYVGVNTDGTITPVNGAVNSTDPTSVTQNAEFTRTAIVDRVNGKLLGYDTNGDGKVDVTDGNAAWTPDSQTLPSVTSKEPSQVLDKDGKAFDQVSQKVVESTTVDHTSGNLPDVTVIYTHKTPSTPEVNIVTGKQTVHYVDGDNNNAKLRDDSVNDTVTFINNNGTWNESRYNYRDANAPVIDGYVTSQKTYEGQTATPEDPNKEITIVYHKIGKIVPVDPNNTPIPDAPTPDYHNDPTDPTKVVPDEPVPTIPGKTPDQSSVTPTDPTKDTPVIYRDNAKDVTTVVHYLDQDENNALILSSPNFTGKEGTQISYRSTDDLKSLTDRGYVLVNNGYDPNNVAPNFDSKVPVYNIVLKHGVDHITPDNPGHGYTKSDLQKTVTRDFQYIFNDGSSHPEVKEDPQSVTFNGQGYFDKVTGQLVTVDKQGNITGPGQITWDKATDTLAAVGAKNVSGYHVVSTENANGDGSVSELTVNPNTASPIHVIVHYALDTTPTPNDETVVGHQTVHYVDGDNNNTKLMDDSINSTFTFTKNGATGQWNETSHKYADANAPVINGYVTSQKTYEGQTGTPSDPNKEITIVYHKIGKIVPVDPNNTPIPDAPTPDYHNDPTDPTKVVPDEPVPTIPGKTPDQSSVTPTDPTKDTPVIYRDNAKDVNGSVTYIDDTTKSTLSTDNFSGKVGDSIDYTTADKIKTYEGQGYELVSNNFNDGNEKFASEGNKFEVHFKHTYSPVTPDNPHGVDKNELTQDVKFTVHYVYMDGSTAHEDNVQNATWTRHETIDNVTGNIVPNGQYTTGWVSDKPSYDAVTSPTITDYTPNQLIVGGRPVTRDNQEVTVIYSKNPETPVKTTADGTIKYIDDTTNSTLSTDAVNGYVGEPINYTTAGKIKTYEDAGYKLVSNNFRDGQEVFANNGNNFEVHFVHNFIPVNPDHPHDGVDPSTYTKNVKETVHYEGAGDKTPADNVQNSVWTRTVTIDQVTGKVVDGGQYDTDWSIKPGEKTVYDQVNTPVINGYHADKRDVPATAVTQDDITQVVTYSPNGKIIPVDPNTKEPIPNAPQPQYPTDPTDPTKVVPDEPVPTIPGLKPSTPTVTPTDPGKDTPVPYTPETPAKDQIAQIIYRDVNDSNNPVQIGTSGNISGKSGSEINYNPSTEIQNFENKGYELKNNGFPAGAVFDNDDSKTQTFYIDFVHKTTTITPDNPGKPGEPINPNDPNGPKWPTGTDVKTLRVDGKQTIHYQYSDHTQAAPDNVQNTTFDHTLVFDNVTGQQVEDRGWTPESHKFNDVISPTINGYHTNQTTVTGATVTPDNPTSEVTVIYTKNGTHLVNQQEVTASQVVKYVDDQGNELRSSKNQNFTFVYSGDTIDDQTNQVISRGSWTEATHDFTAENVPVIDGYVAVSGYTNNNGTYTAGGFTTSHDASDAQRNRTFTVVYKKVGKIIPVDPNHNPISNVPTPQYPNDPVDPTKVTPNEPVPNVPNMTPETPNVTPTDPTTDTPVIYNPDKPVTPAKDQVAQVIYRDVNDPNNITQIGTSGDLTGASGSEINYNPSTEIQNFENKGYELKNNGFPAGAVFDNDDSKTQTFYIDFVHKTTTVTPDNPGKPGEPVDPNNPDGPKYPDGTDEQAVKRTGTQTIHYVGAGDKTPEDNKQSFDFTRTVTFDNVTGRIISSTPWNVSNHTFGTVETPVVDGYHADKRNAGGTTVTPDDLTKEVTVTYSPNGKIVPVDPKGNPIPNVPTPTYPTDPTDPTKVVPDEPVPTVPGMTPSTPTVTPTDPGKDTPVPYNPETPAKDQVAQIIYRDVNDSSNPVQIGTSGDISGQSGSEINYDPSTQIKSFEDKGYVLKNNGFPAGAVFDNDDSKTQTFYIDFVHGTVPVTPDKPGKPGEPINPNDPNGPKWPEGTDENSIKKTGTQTIHYVGAGDKTPADNKQDYIFTKNMVVDKVTGKIIDQGSWNATSHTFGTVETPVVDGYHADKRNAGGTTVTIDDLNKTVTVTYTPNGKIVPVDPNGNPIPDAPTPQYPTDPTDPTKVTPDEPVPTVPGMTPSTPTVTPTDPGKDTPVPYNPDVKDGSVQVIFHDDTTNSTISGVGYNSGSQKDGTKVDYTTDKDISNLENKGYEYVNTDGTIPAEITGDKNVTVIVHMKHGTTPVSPDKPGKPGEPINPNDPDGPKWPDDTSQNNLDKTVTRTITFVDGNGKEVSKPVEQSVHFTATGVIDNVTGKWVTPLTWSPDQTVDSQNVPFVDGYHVVSIDKDGNGLTNVKGVTLHHGDDSYKVTVTYEQNGKIIPVDPNGKPIPDAPTPTYPTDPKDPSKVTPNEPVPNVPGYTPSTPNVTPTDPGKDTPVPYNPDVKDGSVQVIFHDDTTNSTISGVGYNSGSQKDGTKVDYTTAKDISDLENKGYEYVSTDGTVPTEITGDKTITVTVHMKHGTVPVTPDKPGKPGTPINPDDPDGPKWPDDTDAKSLTKDVTRTVSFVDENGNQVSASVTQTVHFTASGVLDKVTGQWLTPLTWNDGQSVSGLTSPSIAGYHVVGVSRDADGNNVKSVVLNHNDPSYVVTVTYAKDNPNSPDSPDVPNPPVQPTVTPGKSNVPTPGNSEVPTPTPAPKPENTPTSEVPAPSPKPESPEAPENNESITPAPKPHAENPETIPAPKPHARKGIAYAPVKGNEVVPTNNTVTSTPASEGQASQAELPQTGDKDDTAATILGATAGMIGLLGLSGFKKKRGKKEEN